MVLAQKTIEILEISPHTYGQSIFNKGGKDYNANKIVYSASAVGKAGQN